MADSKYTDGCFISDYIDIFAAVAATNNAGGYAGFKVVDCHPDAGGGAHEIIAKLTSRNGRSIFNNLKPAAMSLLVPKVRLYKLVYDGKTVISQPEFIFDDFYQRQDVDAIFAGNERRIGGVGLSEATWMFDGTNPAEAPNTIKVNLKFEFQSASDLLGDRYSPDGTIDAGSPDLDLKANMIDLILHPPQLDEAANSAKDEGEYKPNFYRIKMVVGWARPQLQEGRLPGLSSAETQQLLAELSRQRMCIILNLVSHEFDIAEDGKIALAVEYVGALEESLNGNDSDILRVDQIVEERDPITQQQIEENKRKIAELNEYIECLRLSDSAAAEDEIEFQQEEITALEEDTADLNQLVEEVAADEKVDVYTQFLSSLQDKVLEVEVDDLAIEEWIESMKSAVRPAAADIIGESEAASPPENADDAEEVIEEEGEAAFDAAEADAESSNVGNASEEFVKNAREEAQDPEKGYIHYIPLGDILSAAVKAGMGSSNMSVGDSIILTGPVVILHPRGYRFHINLADLPIPYQDFQAFFFENVVRKQLSSYPLKQFLKDILEKLVKKLLQPPECFAKGREGRAVTISNTNFTVTRATALACNFNIESIGTDTPIPRFNINRDPLPPIGIDSGEAGDDVNCLMFYMNNYKAADLVADEMADLGRGIYHFYIGAEGGIVKSIDYQRTDVQGLREARQAEARNLGQIRDVYSANVTLFGNQMFIPGMKVFLNPPIGFGRPEVDGYGDDFNFGSIANLLGIGGYYDVIKVDSTISESGQYETTLQCEFAQSGGTLDSVAGKCQGIIDSISPDLETF